jgi:DNA-binding CsgD family transcriptional regulator
MNRLGSLVCPILVGRDDLLELAERRIGEAAAGRGQLLLLAGEAGVGKSRLLGAIRRKARAVGFLVANGSLSPQDQQLPAALILELARTLARSADTEQLGADLLALGPNPTGDALGSRRRFVIEAADLLARIADRPVMLDFEDVQWADEISLEIVGELARRARELPLLLVASYRREDLPPGAFFREWRARLIAQRTAEEARLAPLTREQTALMTTLILDTGLPAPREVVDAVYRRTDGIPLHVEELLGALSEEAKTDGRAIRDATVPDTIEDAILARLAQLSPETREVARAGAVIGRCFIPAVLAGIMDRPLADLDGPLEELRGRSFLYEADPGYLDFRHQLLRDVLYRTVPATELRRLHARAGEFCAALDGQSETHASVHFERAGMRGQAFRTALAGARAAARISARQESFDLYRRAVDNMPDDLPLEEQAQLFAEYSESAAAIERLDEERQATRLARERYLELGRPLEAADLLAGMAVSMGRDGCPVEDRLAIAEEAIAEVERLPASPGRDQHLGWLVGLRASFELDASMNDAARADAAEAYRLAEATGDRDLELDSELLMARLDILEGNHHRGLSRGLQAAREARDAGFESTGVTGYRNLAIAAARLMDYDAAEASIREGHRYADAIEQSHCRQMMATTSALMAWADGRWDEASITASQELVERGCRRGALGSLDALGIVALSRGDVEESRRRLGESLEAGRRMGEVAFILPPLWGLAEADLVAGEPGGAAARCAEALELAVATEERALLVPYVVTGVRAWLTLQRPDEAERWLTDARAHLAGWETLAAPALLHAEGLIKLATGSLGAARDALEAAARGWADAHRTWEAAWARLDLAQCQLRSNRVAAATLLLVALRAQANELGSRPLLARIGELDRVARGRGSVDEPWRPLTAREFEVARLIAEGLTNGQIAAQLGVAPKTASAHVEHILAKLGVTRRAEIAAWASRIAGLVPVGSRSDAGDRTGAGSAIEAAGYRR